MAPWTTSLLFTAVLLLLSPSSSSSSSRSCRICIIGSGIAGSSAAHFLHKHRDSSYPDSPPLEILILEKRGAVGGRMATVRIAGDEFEAGGTILHPKNIHTLNFTSLLNLTTTIHREDDDNDGWFGIWDGERFVFETLPDGQSFIPRKIIRILNTVRLFRRYGFSLIRMQKFVESMLVKFLRYYEEDRPIFSSVEEMLKWTLLYELTQRTLQDELIDAGLSPLLISELITCSQGSTLIGAISLKTDTLQWPCGKGPVPRVLCKIVPTFQKTISSYITEVWVLDITRLSVQDTTTLKVMLRGHGNVYVITRINYGQDVSISGFAGAVSLAGSSGGLWSVVGGNWQLAAGLIQQANASLHLHEEIISLSNHGDYYELNSSQGNSYHCDVAVIATPLDELDISFSPLVILPKRTLQHTHATLVRGLLNPGYFGLDSALDVPKLVGTLEISSLPFSSISVLKRYSSNDNVYKVFSRTPMADELLDKLFSVRNDTVRIDWPAYPHYVAPEVFAPIMLDQSHLYYINSFESAASTIETSAVAAENVARLILSRISAPHHSDIHLLESDHGHRDLNFKL